MKIQPTTINEAEKYLMDSLNETMPCDCRCLGYTTCNYKKWNFRVQKWKTCDKCNKRRMQQTQEIF